MLTLLAARLRSGAPRSDLPRSSYRVPCAFEAAFLEAIYLTVPTVGRLRGALKWPLWATGLRSASLESTRLGVA